MIISDLAQSRTAEGKNRIEARVTWEDSDRQPVTLWFECGDAPLRLDANAFLNGVFPVAMKHRERRVRVDAPTSALLRSKLLEVLSWWSTWGVTGKEQQVDIEGRVEVPNPGDGSIESCSFLSGGIDSLHTLYDNLDRFPPGHEQRITRGILIRGLNQLPKQRIEAVQPLVTQAIANIAADTGVRFTPIDTNLRDLEPDLPFWGTTFHGPVLGAVAHATIANRGVVRIASTFDSDTMMAPRGSHPLIDSLQSTERVTLLHEGVAYTRLKKVLSLAKHSVALDNAQVCGRWNTSHLNCGRCEKCIRTKLAYMIAGHPISDSFAYREVEPENIFPIRTTYQEGFYAEMAPYLASIGRIDLQRRIARSIEYWPIKNRTRTFAGRLRRSVRSS